MTSLSSSFRCYAPRKVQAYLKIIRHGSSEPVEKIVIPRRIERSPTDILKALAGTVSRDDTAPRYKYHDDPYLTPCSTVSKRSYAMSKESGRKAARWVQDQHPELFQHKVAHPFIKDFAPRIKYDENSVVDETTLLHVISKAEVSNAIKVYELLEKKGIDISRDSKQSFLELLCFFNCEEPIPEDLLEERWFQQSSKGRERLRKTWKDNGLAEKIFLSIEQKNRDVYSAIILGMTRHYQVDRAWQLYEESREKNIVLHTETYNALIRVVNFLRESTELRLKLIEDLLNEMAEKKIQPNTGTLNSVLEGVSSMPNQRLSKNYALRVLAEFRNLNIEPTLASYYFILTTFYKPRSPASNILLEIMNKIEGKEFTIQDPKDTFFFVTAMDVCKNHLQDKDLAYRVHKLLNTGNNYVLVGDAYKESIYYRHFFTIMCAFESFDVFMDLYFKIVPHTYTPESSIMEEVIKTIEMNGAIEHIPKIWSDIVLFDHTLRDNIVSALLNCMVRNEPQKGSDLIAQFASIAWDIWTRNEEVVMEQKYSQWRWTGLILGDIMTILIRGDLFKEACVIMDKLNDTPQEITGIPNVESFQLFLDKCIELKNAKIALRCVRYCADAAFSEAEQMAQHLINSLPITEDSLEKLSRSIGKDLKKDS